MKAVRYYLIGFSWLPVIALAAWWAGFMPFPTRPAEVGLQGYTFDGIGGSGKESRSLISAATAKEKGKAAPYGLGQWYCGDDQKQGADPDPKHCHIYEVREEPFFGWVSPSWLLTVNTMRGGATPVAFYGTYAACKWTEEHKQKTDEDNRVNYERWATEQHQKIESQEYEFYSCVRVSMQDFAQWTHPVSSDWTHRAWVTGGAAGDEFYASFLREASFFALTPR